MFKVKWDSTQNLIVLDNKASDEEELVPPRPVYTEELKLLGFDRVVELPAENVPVCWDIDKKYYYSGKLIATVKGGNIYDDATVEFSASAMPESLVPIDIGLLVQTNKDAIFTIENEAIDFIKNTYEKYVGKVSAFVVAFSGGKDSQVILDLVSRVIPVEHYKTVFTNTGMELPCTIDTVGNTEEYYKKRYPSFKLHKAQSDKNAVDLWAKYGSPSRFNRWCCSVLKTALFSRKMKELLNTHAQPRVVVFEGVRADESAGREGYNRIGEGVKHANLINCRAIFKWNLSEIFLYLYSRNIEINPAYSMGLTRVGCSVCPFASDWSEFIIQKRYPTIAKKYTTIIEDMARNIGVGSQKKIDEYIASGNWKENAGGKGLIQDNSRIDILSKEPDFECVVMNPKTDWRIWFQTMTQEDPIISLIKNDFYRGEFRYEGEIVKFEVKMSDDRIQFEAFNTVNKIMLISHLSKVFTKAAFCELCGVCEAECPTGALMVREKVTLDSTYCIHCHNCLDINTKGCIIATRRQMYEGGNKVGGTATKTSGIDRYSTFGTRDTAEDPRVSSFFSKMDEWFIGYAGLGSKQIPALLSWFREAELVDMKDKKVTELAKLLKPVFLTNPALVWQVIWINLSFNSAVANWYTENIKLGVTYSRNALIDNIKEIYPSLNETTLGNPISALINTFASTPLGHATSDEYVSEENLHIGILTKSGNGVKELRKEGSSIIQPAAVAYLLYKNAEKNDQYEITVADLYEKGVHGIYNVFGMPSEAFINTLRALMNMGILTADLLGGLDNIHLNRNNTSFQILKDLISRM